MLKDGTITVEEAEELLRALESNQPAAEPAAVPVAMKDNRGRKAKKLRVQVDNRGKRNQGESQYQCADIPHQDIGSRHRQKYAHGSENRNG